MDTNTSQPNIPELGPHRNWLARHMILGYVFLFAVIAATVAGIYYWQTAGSVPSTIDLPVHKEKVDPMAGWKTYTNDQYGFEFKYPTGHELIKNDPVNNSPGLEYHSVSFAVEDQHFGEKGYDDTITFSVHVGSGNPENYLKNAVGARFDEGISNGKLKRTTFASRPAITDNSNFLSGGFSSTYIHGKDDGYFILIEQGSNKEPLSQILSTFKFTDSSSSADAGPASPASAINSFTKCADAGNPIMESFPEQCRTPEGVTFTKQYQSCVQVITAAKNPKTGEIRDFPTPCDVPAGWEVVSNSSNK